MQPINPCKGTSAAKFVAKCVADFGRMCICVCVCMTRPTTIMPIIMLMVMMLFPLVVMTMLAMNCGCASRDCVPLCLQVEKERHCAVSVRAGTASRSACEAKA